MYLNITQALQLAKELRALVRLKIITKKQANHHFRKHHRIPLYRVVK